MKIHAKLQPSIPYFIFFLTAVFIILRGVIVCSQGTDLAGIEQNVIYSIQVLMDTGKLYFPPSEPPFSIPQYTPVFYYLCFFTTKLWNCSPDDIQALYIIGRSWNVVFNVITAFLVLQTGRKIFRFSVNTSLFIALLSFVVSFPHNFAARPDSLHDMLGMASVYCFLYFIKKGYNGKKANGLIFLIVLLTALSVFTKQSGIQFIIIFSGFCLINRKWNSFLKFMFFSLIIYGAFLLGFRFMYHSLFENIVGGVANGINIDNFIRFVITKRIFILTVWPLILFTLFLIIQKNTIFKGKSEERALAICALGTLIFASATALKMGSTVQYYIVFVNISLIMVMKYLSGPNEEKNSNENQYSARLRRKNLLTYLFFGLIILAFAAQNIKLLITFDHNPVLAAQRKAAKKTAAFIQKDRVKNSGRYIFSNLTTDYIIASRQNINNIFFRESLIPQMDILEYSTGPSKVVDYKKFENMLRDGEVEYLIDSKPKSPFSILENLDSIKTTHFKLVREIDGYLIYKFYPN